MSECIATSTTGVTSLVDLVLTTVYLSSTTCRSRSCKSDCLLAVFVLHSCLFSVNQAVANRQR